MIRKGFLLGGLMILLLLPAGCSVFERGEQSSPKKLVEAYLEAFRSADLERMIALSGGWEASEEELDFYKKLVELVELKSYTVEQVEMVSKSEAVVQVTVTLSLLGDDRTHTDRLRVIKEEGQWYLVEGILD